MRDPESPGRMSGGSSSAWSLWQPNSRPAYARRRRPATADLVLYEDAILHLLYQRYYRISSQRPSVRPRPKRPGRWRFYNNFLADWRRFFHIEGVAFPTGHDPRHTFACFRQIQRAFEQVFRDIIGSSMPAARLRASIWQSIFTHDIRRYRRTLYARMGEFATLITGPSGTGKELVARAIAQSRYVPFDDQRLVFPGDGGILPHQYFGAFAHAGRIGTVWPPARLVHRRRRRPQRMAGDLSRTGFRVPGRARRSGPAIQVKLLRVIETRTFHPVGDTASRQFRGKLITATNRDLAALIAEGRFREDLYYRLCSDQVETPALAEQLADSPAVLRELVFYMSRRVAGEEAETLAAEVLDWVAAEPAAGLCLARQLSRVGAVREEHADSPELSALPAESHNAAEQFAQTSALESFRPTNC